MPADADVIVVGAGPAGSATATLLARSGARVLLTDKAAAPPPKVCGEYLSPGCLPILERLGVLAPLRESGARPLHGMLIHTAGGRTLRAVYPASPPGSTPPYALSITRARLDPILLELARNGGATFLPNFQACDLLWQGGRVTGVVGRLGATHGHFRAPLVIGADGRQSVVARRIGAVRQHRGLDRMAVVAHLRGVRREDEIGEIFLARGRYAILNPIGTGLTNLGLVVDRRALTRGVDPRRILWDMAASFPGLADRLGAAEAVAPVRCLGPLAHRATRLAVPGALLVGDAAGFLDPFTGEGIYAALRSAELASRVALAQDPARAYAETWRREFLPKWRLAFWLQRAVRRPWCAELLAVFLAGAPARVATLMAAFGDMLPSDDLRPVPLLWRLAGLSGGPAS
jgi:geranylgeranyl reductase family protein